MRCPILQHIARHAQKKQARKSFAIVSLKDSRKHPSSDVIFFDQNLLHGCLTPVGRWQGACGLHACSISLAFAHWHYERRSRGSIRADLRERDEDSNFSVFRTGGSLNGPDLFTELPFLWKSLPNLLFTECLPLLRGKITSFALKSGSLHPLVSF